MTSGSADWISLWYQASHDAEHARLAVHGEIVEAARRRKFGYAHQALERAVKIVSSRTPFAMRTVWHWYCTHERSSDSYCQR